MQDLWGACKKNIENGLCLGCSKLEMERIQTDKQNAT